jgi:hypothetical protein
MKKKKNFMSCPWPILKCQNDIIAKTIILQLLASTFFCKGNMVNSLFKSAVKRLDNLWNHNPFSFFFLNLICFLAKKKKSSRDSFLFDHQSSNLITAPWMKRSKIPILSIWIVYPSSKFHSITEQLLQMNFLCRHIPFCKLTTFFSF